MREERWAEEKRIKMDEGMTGWCGCMGMPEDKDKKGAGIKRYGCNGQRKKDIKKKMNTKRTEWRGCKRQREKDIKRRWCKLELQDCIL